MDEENEKEIARTDPTEIEAVIERFKQSTHNLKKEDTDAVVCLSTSASNLLTSAIGRCSGALDVASIGAPSAFYALFSRACFTALRSEVA